MIHQITRPLVTPITRKINRPGLILPSGPDLSGSVIMHWWPPEDPITDDAAGGLDLTAYGSPTLGSGTGPGGVDVINFSAGNHLRQTSVDAFGVSAGFAVSCYVNFTSDPPSQSSAFILSHQSASDQMVQLIYTKTTGEFRFRLFNTSNVAQEAAGGTKTNGQWHYLVGLFDGTYLQLWVDNVLVDQTEWTGGTFQTAAGAFALGSLANAPAGGYDFIGAGYDFKIYT